MKESIEKVENGPENERICLFCNREINLNTDAYSQEWQGSKKVWMHNTCRYEHSSDIKKAF